MQNLLQFIYSQLPNLGEKTLEQLYLVALSTSVAIIIGVLLGIWVVRKPRWQMLILGTASILQTIPSLALLVFLLPFLGIGMVPALVTLATYALLPIVRNTVTGLKNISPALLTAADGLGFTRWQRLRLVEFPLAMPTIVTGIRTATTMSMGIATLAAFVGAGGLGDFIYQGLVLNNIRLVLLGAVPAAILALLLDYMTGKFQQKISQNIHEFGRSNSNNKLKFSRSAIVILVIIGGLFLISKPLLSNFKQPNTIRIATKNSTEQFIVGELMAQIIAHHTQLHIERKFNLGNTAICQQALLNNEIDLYPEYTGTAYMTVLHESVVLPEQETYDYVHAAYLKQFNLVWLPAFGFNDTQALIVRNNFARDNKLSNISHIIPLAGGLTMGVQAAFLQRPDAYPRLREYYQLTFKSAKIMDAALMYNALRNKQLDAILGNSTDGRIPNYNLQILNDNKHVFPAYYAAPVVRKQFLDKYPEVEAALKLLVGLMSDQAMQRLNAQVDIDKRSPAEVAHEFLQAHRLI